MAKLTAPIYSTRATGSLANRLSFQRYKNFARVIAHPDHPDARSGAQLTQRAHFSNAATLWHLLTQPQRDAFIPGAKPLQITYWMYFVKRYLIASLAPPPTETLYQNQTGAILDVVEVEGDIYFGQTFVPQTTHDLTKITLSMASAGNPGDQILRLYHTDASHHPTGPALSTQIRPGSDIGPLPFHFVDWKLVFLNMAVGTEYAIVYSSPTSSSPNLGGLAFSGGDLYPAGGVLVSVDSGTTWVYFPAFDFLFQEWGLPS